MEQEQIENEEITEIENPLEDVIYNRIGNVFKFDFPKKNIRIRLDKIPVLYLQRCIPIT